MTENYERDYKAEAEEKTLQSMVRGLTRYDPLLPIMIFGRKGKKNIQPPFAIAGGDGKIRWLADSNQLQLSKYRKHKFREGYIKKIRSTKSGTAKLLFDFDSRAIEVMHKHQMLMKRSEKKLNPSAMTLFVNQIVDELMQDKLFQLMITHGEDQRLIRSLIGLRIVEFLSIFTYQIKEHQREIKKLNLQQVSNATFSDDLKEIQVPAGCLLHIYKIPTDRPNYDENYDYLSTYFPLKDFQVVPIFSNDNIVFQKDNSLIESIINAFDTMILGCAVPASNSSSRQVSSRSTPSHSSSRQVSSRSTPSREQRTIVNGDAQPQIAHYATQFTPMTSFSNANFDGYRSPLYYSNPGFSSPSSNLYQDPSYPAYPEYPQQPPANLQAQFYPAPQCFSPVVHGSIIGQPVATSDVPPRMQSGYLPQSGQNLIWEQYYMSTPGINVSRAIIPGVTVGHIVRQIDNNPTSAGAPVIDEWQNNGSTEQALGSNNNPAKVYVYADGEYYTVCEEQCIQVQQIDSSSDEFSDEDTSEDEDKYNTQGQKRRRTSIGNQFDESRDQVGSPINIGSSSSDEERAEPGFSTGSVKRSRLVASSKLHNSTAGRTK